MIRTYFRISKTHNHTSRGNPELHFKVIKCSDMGRSVLKIQEGLVTKLLLKNKTKQNKQTKKPAKVNEV